MTQFALVIIFMLVSSSAYAATLIENRGDALAYIDRTFQSNDCRFNRKAFFDRMVVDGVAPGVDDMAQPFTGTKKIIRQRRILATLEGLFAEGLVCEDQDDQTIAISKFGGCA